MCPEIRITNQLFDVAIMFIKRLSSMQAVDMFDFW